MEGKQTSFKQNALRTQWLGAAGGWRQAGFPTAWLGCLAHLEVIGLVGQAKRQNLGLHTTGSLMIVCKRVRFGAQSPSRERVRRNVGEEGDWVHDILLECQEHLLGQAKVFREITLPNILPCSGV